MKCMHTVAPAGFLPAIMAFLISAAVQFCVGQAPAIASEVSTDAMSTTSSAAQAKSSDTSPAGRRSHPGIIPAPPERTYPERPLIVGFVLDRALDLCDLLRVRFHVPHGYRSVGAKVRATVLAQLGAIFFEGKSVGLDRRGVGLWREWRLEGGVGPVYGSRVKNEMIAGNRYTNVEHPWSRMYRRGIVRNGVLWDDGRLQPLSVGVELHLFVFGVELETYPQEWLDAVIGWLGLDSANDDESRILRRWNEWQTIPELNIRNEWKETLKQPDAGKD
ncbi:MAG: hypothetical protein N3D11_13880 [Candidatus Sumerlaeia bacterium]|nr:hypothetical protein [Candidatus Sumerlaeia bacterium]